MIGVWEYLLGASPFGRHSLEVLLQFLDTPQTFRLLQVATQFRQRALGYMTQFALLSRRGGPNFEWVTQICPHLNVLHVLDCTWFQGELFPGAGRVGRSLYLLVVVPASSSVNHL